MAELRKQFAAILKLQLDPLLRSAGFKGSGWKWRRLCDPVISCITLQSKSDGTACCVNLGVHLSFLPIAGRLITVDTSKVVATECQIRTRASWPGESDHWWRYDKPSSESQNLVACIRDEGMPFFGRFADFPRPFTDIRPGALNEETHRLMPGTTSVVKYLTLARIHDHLGNANPALELARLGLQNAGQATMLKPDFREIIAKYE